MDTHTTIEPARLPATIRSFLAAHTAREGDFPGGVAELRYRFTLDGDLIEELVIAP
jgi:hypothetical protein